MGAYAMGDFLEQFNVLLPKGIAKPHTQVKSAQGSFITDVHGKKYLDFITGIGVTILGHNHPKIITAIQEQLTRFDHTCFGIIGYPSYVELLEKMVRLFPHHPTNQPGKTKGYLTNSGTDSVENAVKLARAYTHRTNLICFTNSFHGRNYMTMHLTDRPTYRKYCGPAPGEIYRLRFPQFYIYGKQFGFQDEESYLAFEIKELEHFFNETINPEETAAVIAELVQGEGGGFSVMPKVYLKRLHELCREHGILIIIDEVQSGFARTGKWAAYQHYQDIGFDPDITTWAKAMGSGYPIGSVLGKAEILDGVPKGIMGGTYWGNPIACASANVTINIMEELNLPVMAMERGEVIRSHFNELYQKYEVVGEVRGLGAMLAIELSFERSPLKPAKELTQKIITACRNDGLLLVAAGHNGNVIRILCPLNIELNNLRVGLNILTNCFAKLAK